MTPYLTPQTATHQRFNAALCRTRVLIEQSFGILKRRFSCLQGTLRQETIHDWDKIHKILIKLASYGVFTHIVRTNPEQAVSYIVACVVLHNLGIQTGDVMDRHDQPVDRFDQNAHHLACNSQEGSRMRDYIAQTYFG
jgi:hypothetical protein